MDSSLKMVFDVESIGLHGEGWAVGYVVISGGEIMDRAWAWCPPDSCSGHVSGRDWVRENCEWAHGEGEPYAGHPYVAGKKLASAKEIRDWFWTRWEAVRSSGGQLWADVPWPVEARFLIACVEDASGGQGRVDTAPYPLYDVQSVVRAYLGATSCKGRVHLADPVAMVHHPLADAIESALKLVRVEAELLSIVQRVVSL